MGYFDASATLSKEMTMPNKTLKSNKKKKKEICLVQRMQTFSEAFYPLSSSTGDFPVTLHDHFPISVKWWGRTQVMVKDERHPK